MVIGNEGYLGSVKTCQAMRALAGGDADMSSPVRPGQSGPI